MKLPPLNTNVRSYLAFLVTLGCLLIYNIVLFREVRANDTITNQIVTSIGNITVFVLGYFFGAAKPQSQPDQQQPGTEVTIKKVLRPTIIPTKLNATVGATAANVEVWLVPGSDDVYTDGVDTYKKSELLFHDEQKN